MSVGGGAGRQKGDLVVAGSGDSPFRLQVVSFLRKIERVCFVAGQPWNLLSMLELVELVRRGCRNLRHQVDLS
jgi:hypothetical protein